MTWVFFFVFYNIWTKFSIGVRAVWLLFQNESLMFAFTINSYFFQFGADKSLLQMANEVKRHLRRHIFSLLPDALWHSGTWWEWSGGRQWRKGNDLLKVVWLFGLKYCWFIRSLSVINLQESKRINSHWDRSLYSESASSLEESFWLSKTCLVKRHVQVTQK